MRKHQKDPFESLQNKWNAFAASVKGALTKNKYTLPVLGGSAAAVVAVAAAVAFWPQGGAGSSLSASSAPAASQSYQQVQETYKGITK